MKKLFLLVACVVLSFTKLQAQETLNLKDIANGHYYPEQIYGVNPMNDGETYTQISPDRKRIVRFSFKTGKEVGVVFDAEKARGKEKIRGIDGYIMSPDETRILIQTKTQPIYRHSFTAVYYIYNVQNNSYEPLSNGGPQQVPLFSPDGTMVAFVRDNNLFLVKLLFGNSESQITKDGKRNEVLNGIPDWVYEEEFSMSRAFDFSSDSQMLAWVRSDESKVPVYSMQEFKGMYPEKSQYDEYPGAYLYKYPVAGAKNSEVSVLTFDIQSRVTRTLQVPVESEGYIPRIKFTTDPNQLAVVTLNRHQNQMDIYMANPRSTVCKLAVRENSDKYIKETAYGSLKFYNGRFAYLSDRSGFQHIYLYSLNGTLERQLTSGNFDVTNFYGYEEKTGKCYYASRQKSPLRKAVYVSEKNGKVKKLSNEVGTNNATFSKSLKYFMNVYSSATQPPVTTLCDNTGRKLTTLLDNAKLKAKTDPILGKKEFFSFTTSEGVQLNGWMIKPRNFDATKKYPVIMYQYSGPGSQEVLDSWRAGFYGGTLWETFLAQQGYVVVCVDGRGTGGRGAEFKNCTYLELGLRESEDQVETAKYLATLPYVDKSRIGIWGWSFGGYNTLMSMSTGEAVFKAGIAVAPPTDWRFYDSVYTERFMRTPQENGENYDKTSAITRARNLNGSLLLMHGMADDNVHVRNSVEYSEALVQADKQFDMHYYTNRNHSIYGGNTRYHIFTKMFNFWNEKLK